MRRYLFNHDVDKMKKTYYDVVIIGSGISGLHTALNIDEKLACAVLAKEDIRNCNSYYAQGGIAAVIQQEDTLELHYNDTLYAGAGICDEEAVKKLVSEGPKEIEYLISAGIQFDIDNTGKILLTKEGGHSKRRILHCGGDSTGRAIEEKLFDWVAKKQNVVYKENTFLVDILTLNKKAYGVVVYDEDYQVYISPNIVICTGGIGQVYKYTTNPKVATGDGIAAALRAGAELSNMEFIQFHPTALYSSDKQEKYFLISEAVRGEGGVLRNHNGECFMYVRHPMGDLAPRDVVAREIFHEISSSGIPYVYLDITSKTREYLNKRFPTIYQECLKRGIDMATEYIPVCPVQHYFMGGIKTDLNGRSSIKGLYACGEAGYTGVHGANRLASNSLLECLTFAKRCAEDINQSTGNRRSHLLIKFQNENCYNINIDIEAVIEEIKYVMSTKCGIVRTQQGLAEGLIIIENILLKLEKLDLLSVKYMEAVNMATVAKQILIAALARKDSVGAHYREELMSGEGGEECSV